MEKLLDGAAVSIISIVFVVACVFFYIVPIVLVILLVVLGGCALFVWASERLGIL